jgi:hypothetical protein
MLSDNTNGGGLIGHENDSLRAYADGVLQSVACVLDAGIIPSQLPAQRGNESSMSGPEHRDVDGSPVKSGGASRFLLTNTRMCPRSRYTHMRADI